VQILYNLHYHVINEEGDVLWSDSIHGWMNINHGTDWKSKLDNLCEELLYDQTMKTRVVFININTQPILNVADR
jgi:hypothetical protein